MHAAAVTRAADFQAGAGGGVQLQPSGVALRHRTRQPGHLAGLGQPHIIEQHGGGAGLAVRELAERIDAGGGERLGQPLPRGGRRRRYGIRRAAWRVIAERDVAECENFGGVQPAQQARHTRQWNILRLEDPGGHIEPRRPHAPAVLHQPRQQIRPRRVEQRLLGQRAGGDQPHHGPADRRLADAKLRIFHLLANRHAKAAPDEAGQIGVRRMHGHAAHLDRPPGVLAAMGQRDVERRRRRIGIGEKHLVEIAHAKEQQRVRVLRLQREPLRHRGRGAFRNEGRVG